MWGIRLNTLIIKKFLVLSFLLFAFPISLKLQYAFLGLTLIITYIYILSGIFKSQLKTSKTALLAIPFFIWVFLSILQKQIKYNFRISDYRLLATYTIYFIFLLNSYEAKTKEEKKKELLKLTNFFVLLLSIPIIAGSLIWFIKPDIFFPFLNTFEYQKNGEVFNVFWNGRYLSYFINPNDFSYILITVMWGIILILRSYKGITLIIKLGYGIIFAASYICFINSASRGGWLAVGLGIGLYLWLMKDKIFKKIKIFRGKSLLAFGLSVTMACLSVAFFYSSYIALSYYNTYTRESLNSSIKNETKQVEYSRNLVSQAKSNISNGRFDIWTIYSKGFWVEPLFGVTHNNTETIYKYFQEKYPNDSLSSKTDLLAEFPTPHNIIFMLIGYYGLGGLLLFVVFILTIAVKSLKMCKTSTINNTVSNNVYIYIMIVCYWGMIVFEAMVGNILIEYFTCINIIAWDSLGYLISTRNDIGLN